MIRTIVIFLSLVKLILLIGCSTPDHMIGNPGSSAKFIQNEPATCSREYMKSCSNYPCENLIYAALDDLKKNKSLRFLPPTDSTSVDGLMNKITIQEAEI